MFTHFFKAPLSNQPRPHSPRVFPQVFVLLGFFWILKSRLPDAKKRTSMKNGGFREVDLEKPFCEICEIFKLWTQDIFESTKSPIFPYVVRLSISRKYPEKEDAEKVPKRRRSWFQTISISARLRYMSRKFAITRTLPPTSKTSLQI